MPNRINHNLTHTSANNQVQQTNLLTKIEKNTANINVNVGDVEINVQDVEALLATTNTKLSGGLPSALTGSGHLSISIDEIGNTGSEKLAVNLDTQISQHFPTALSGSGRLKVESHITDHSKESKQDTVIGHLGTVAGAVSGSEMQCDVLTMPTVAVTLAGGATEAKQDVQETTLDAILAKNTELETLLSTIDADTNDIKTSVQLLDNAISGNELQVDIVSSALPSGAATESTLQTIAEFNCDTTDVTVTSLIPGISATSLGKAIQSAQGSTDTGIASLAVRNDALADLAGADHDYAPLQVDSSGALYCRNPATELAVTGTNSILTTIDADTNDIKTSLQLIDNAIDGNYLNINQNIAGTDVDSNSGNKSAATQRVVIATDDVNLSAIKTSVQLIDNAMHTGVIPSSALNVSVATSALPSGAATDNSILSMRVREDEANTAGQYLMGVSAVIRQDTLASLVGTSGDNTQMSVNASGALYCINSATDGILTTIDEDTNAIKTSVQLLDDVVGTDGATGPAKCMSMAGTESGGAIQELLVDAAGHLQIDVLSAPSTVVTNAVLTSLDDAINSSRVDVNIANGGFGGAVTNAGLTAIDAAIGTDGATGPAKCMSMAGTESGGAIQELLVDANGHLQIDVISAPSTAVTGAVTATLSATDNAVIDVIAAKTTLSTTSELKTLLSGVTVNSGAQSSQFDTENYDKARFFGETTASVGTDIILMGAATDGGQAYVLGENLRSESIGGVHYIYGPEVENLPRYIRILNKSGSTNYVFTKLFMQLSGGRLAV